MAYLKKIKLNECVYTHSFFTNKFVANKVFVTFNSQKRHIFVTTLNYDISIKREMREK